VNRIVVDTQAAVKRVKQHIMSWSGGKPPEGVFIDHHREALSILDYFRVNAAVREALKPRVDLPSGGYIIIEPTEALTVIDVNSGSFTRSATARETVLWTNSEAATEIARQLRLRNIGGVVIVDFIDMDTRRDQLKLLEHFNQTLKADKARPQIAQLSELGLVELTRKRQGKNIYELFGEACPTCGGLGHLVHLPGETELIALEAPSTTPPVAISKPMEKPVDLGEPFGESAYDDDFSDTPRQLDLLNHPSYQEQSMAGNNRRRRRRQPPGPVIKEEPIQKVITSVGVKEIEYEPEPEIEPKKERIQRHIRREEVPIEKVSVEMTPLEQDVYALMGISPLVRVEREFKDPKSVFVSIKSVESRQKEKVEEDVEVEIPEKVTQVAPEPMIMAEALESDLELDEEREEDNLMSPDEIENEIERPIIRRRRRRSSAAGS
jgi:ribonuclease E